MLKLKILLIIKLLVKVTPFDVSRPHFRSNQPSPQRQRKRTAGIFAGETPWPRANDQRRHAVDGDTSDDDDDGSSSYQSSASLTKGIVSSLTSLSNSVFRNAPSASSSSPTRTTTATSSRGPTSPRELLSRIRGEYTENNYLWTGDLDTSSFVSDCTFTDPTLSFVGVDKFVENVGNLAPVVKYLLGEEQLSRSDLLNITLNDDEDYIETRWNMVGELNQLFWKPKIDVIGRTKFWYRRVAREGEGGRRRGSIGPSVFL